jgi:hypothetical protein
MWQDLVQQVGIPWIILVCLATVALAALAILLYVAQQRMVNDYKAKINSLSHSIESLEGHRIENLEVISDLVDKTMNQEFKMLFKRLKEDGAQIFGSIWIPDPKARLTIPDSLPSSVRSILRKKNPALLLLGGIFASALALVTGYILRGSLINDPLLRFWGAIPFVISLLALLVMYEISERHLQEIRNAWQSLISNMERRVPVYSQAAETAALISQMKSYDARMADSAMTLAEHVKSLASGRLTEALTNGVKFVMSTTIAPSLTRSTETLGNLAQELEKQMALADHAVAKLYSEMEVRQQKQSDLFMKRFQETADILTGQLGTLTKNLSAGQQQLVDDLGRSQTFSLERIVDEQKQTLQHMNNVAQKSWTILQDKLTLVLNQLAEGQIKLLNNLHEQQQNTLTTISESSTQTSEKLQQQYQTILDQLRQAQIDIWQQQDENQKKAYDTLVISQKESFTSLTEQQMQVYERSEKAQQASLSQMQANQTASLQQLTENQAAILKEIDGRQGEALQTISSQQAAALLTISDQQANALQQMNSVQNLTLNNISRTQEETLAIMASRQQEALQKLSERFSSEVSGTLAKYLAPVTDKLLASAETLIAAQDYARDIKDVLKLQHDQASNLQDSIHDLFSQLVDTRKAMTEDLQSLKSSTHIISKATDSMSSIYAGSQSGLNEAINQMSNDLMRLSDVLSKVMATSAEQSREIQNQTKEIYEINQKHLDAVRGQINILSDELSTRIEQLMIGFSSLTEELVMNIDKTVNTQNVTLGSSLNGLTEIMGNEARSMSLFAQQINMDIDTLNETLRSAVGEFDSGIRLELTSMLGQFDHEVADVVKRLAQAAVELGDSVEALPQAIRHASAVRQANLTSNPDNTDQ